MTIDYNNNLTRMHTYVFFRKPRLNLKRTRHTKYISHKRQESRKAKESTRPPKTASRPRNSVTKKEIIMCSHRNAQRAQSQRHKGQQDG